MKTRNYFFWWSVTTIAVISVIVSFYSNSSGSESEVIFIKRVLKQSGVYELLSLLSQILRQSRGLRCDNNKWKSPLIAKYKAALILTVDLHGCGKFKSLQKAVDSIPKNNAKYALIILDNGIYKEKVTIKTPNIILQGQGHAKTQIVWNDTADKTAGTIFSYTVGIYGKNFIAYHMGFKNSAPRPLPKQTGKQAVALRIAGDQACFYDCGFFGFQDTLNDAEGRHYFKNCYIEGAVDFIFGNGRSLYEDTTIKSLMTHIGHVGAIAAQQKVSTNQKTGFSFLRGKIEGTGKVWLGRAWGSYSTVVFANFYMANVISPDGWNAWTNVGKEKQFFFGEYNCSGPGSNRKGRVKYSKNLTATEAKPFMGISYIDGSTWIRH